MSIRYHAGPERIWFDDGVEAVSLYHADDGVYEFPRWAVLADINMYLVVPEKFISQGFFKAAAELLRQRYRVDGLSVDPVAEIVALCRL